MSSVLELQHPSDVALDDHLARDASALTRRERIASASLSAAFCVVATLAALLAPSTGGAGWLAMAVATAVTAAAMDVRFDIAGGFTVPTQLGFVPLLLCAPPAWWAPLAAVAVVLGRVPAVRAGELRSSRLLLSLPNCTFVLGPALLLAAAPGIAGWSVAPFVAVTFAAQVVVDFALASWREWYEVGTPLPEQLTDALPVYAVDLALTPAAAAVGALAHHEPVAALALLPLLGLLGVFSRERRHRMEGLQELNAAHRGVALVLGDVIEADDGYTGAHSKGVVELACAVGAELGLDARRQRDLEFGAMLHDVGKVAVPKSIINKPSALDADEWELVKQHTVHGQRMLERVGGFMAGVGVIVRAHHERWDGAGYPDGLRGAGIPLEARIIAGCDSYNAMTTDRPYRRAMSADVALAELRANAGSQFDPDVVDAMVRLLEGPSVQGSSTHRA